jgi:hypothetical protein
LYVSRRTENPLTFRSLYDSPIVSVRDYCCRAGRGGPAAEEHSGGNDIVLMRHGAFCKHFGRRSVTADVNQAVFFSRGSTYRISHPADCGDRGTVFVPSPRVLNDIIREVDPSVKVPMRHEPEAPARGSRAPRRRCGLVSPAIVNENPAFASRLIGTARLHPRKCSA